MPRPIQPPSELTQMLTALAAGDRVSEREFDLIFPSEVRKFSRTHWTPLAAALRAAQLLAPNPGARVLDVGSGCGKLCLISALTTKGQFTGIEQDRDFAATATSIAKLHRIPRVQFIAGDALERDWSKYESLYLFNPFANHVENEAEFLRIVEKVTQKLASLGPATRVVTYHGFGGQMPSTFVQELAEAIGPGILQLWVKR